MLNRRSYSECWCNSIVDLAEDPDVKQKIL